MPTRVDPRVLVDYRTGDDAGVYRLDEANALVQTVDFFTPVVDDPEAFGAIAAANALSDVYAMGGRPLSALSIAALPDRDFPEEWAAAIIRAGAETLAAAGCALLGGHSVRDVEIKYGYAITGLVDPRRILTNAGGPGILATDAVEHAGLRLAGIEQQTVAKLRTQLSEASNFYNPIDVLGDADLQPVAGGDSAPGGDTVGSDTHSFGDRQ